MFVLHSHNTPTQSCINRNQNINYIKSENSIIEKNIYLKTPKKCIFT